MPPEAEPLDRLVDSFRAQLDEALIRAISSDYDIDTPSGYESATQILNDLADTAAAEEAAIFQPTDAPEVNQHPSSHREDGASSVSSGSRQTSLAQKTESSQTDSSSPSTPQYSVPRLTSFDKSSEADKIAQLREMFTGLKDFDIETALKKSKGDFQGALDELLNIQDLELSGQRQKGVDGFFRLDEEDQGPVVGKGKKKGKKRQQKRSGALSPVIPDSPGFGNTSAKDHVHQDEIAFLADRIDMSYDEVSTIYYNKKCSAGAAAANILEQFAELGIRAQDDDSKAQAQKLGKKYANVPEHHLLTLVQVTGSPHTQYAEDVADLLSRHFAKNPFTQRMDLTHRLTPLPNEDLESATASLPGINSPWKTTASSKSMTPTSRGAPGGLGVMPAQNLTIAMQKVLDAQQTRREASSQASALHRRGGALYKQAAHVYTERAQLAGTQTHHLSSAVADLLVDQQSTSLSCDLHGVGVQDGVRIAKTKVWNWWRGLGEMPSRQARITPFTVITGLGRHSEGGVGRLRRAVAPALIADGWRFRIETGSFVVVGRL